jgi:hypothetical protein
MEKMMTSWEAPDSLSSFRFFFQMWAHWLHHHLMHHYCTPSYTWGCHHPLTNAKVRKKRVVWYIAFGQAPSQKEPHRWCWLEFLMCVGNSFYSICKWAQYIWQIFKFSEILKILELVIF